MTRALRPRVRVRVLATAPVLAKLRVLETAGLGQPLAARPGGPAERRAAELLLAAPRAQQPEPLRLVPQVRI